MCMMPKLQLKGQWEEIVDPLGYVQGVHLEPVGRLLGIVDEERMHGRRKGEKPRCRMEIDFNCNIVSEIDSVLIIDFDRPILF